MGDLDLEVAIGLGYARIQQYHFAVSEGEPMPLANHIPEIWCRIQGELFPESNCSPPMQAPKTPQQFQSQLLRQGASFSFDCEDLRRPLSTPSLGLLC